MIRLGDHADIPAILAIGQQVIDASKTYDCPVDPIKASKLLRRSISDKRMDLFVATKADIVVGFFIAIADEQWFAKSVYASDLAFCVLPEHTDQGVWLLRLFMRWCKSNSIKQIQLGLSTGMDEQGRTGRMYEAHGLQLVGGIYATTKQVK